MPRIREYRIVLHQKKMLFGYNLAAAGYGNEEVADSRCFAHSHNFKTVHYSFHCFYRINLGYDNLRSQTLSAHGNTLAAPTVARHDDVLTRDDKICSTVYTIPYRLSGSVSVVKQMLTVGVVYQNHREFKCFFLIHGNKSDYSRCGLLATADNIVYKFGVFSVYQTNQIAAVIYDYIRCRLYHSAKVCIINLL